MRWLAGPSVYDDLLSKAPQATLMFWVVKICATTVGETGGDAVSMTLRLGYAMATAIFAVFFACALAAQLRARRYHPAIYWLTVVSTTTMGTVTSDFADRTLHLGYVRSSAILLVLVVAVLLAWRFSAGRIVADHIASRQDERFYWLTILVSNTLGTALGDFTAARAGLGLGFELGACIFASLIALVALLYWGRRLPRAVAFWAAYVLTRPLGATLGDTLTKPHVQGGIGFGRFSATFAIAGAMVLLIISAPSLRTAPLSIPTELGNRACRPGTFPTSIFAIGSASSSPASSAPTWATSMRTRAGSAF